MMDDRSHVAARLVHGAVDEPLGIRSPSYGIDGRPIENEFHQVLDLDALRRPRPREDVALRPIRVTDADVPERVDDALAREYAVGRDELVERPRQRTHCRRKIT